MRGEPFGQRRTRVGKHPAGEKAVRSHTGALGSWSSITAVTP